jgi:hypothetical protein
MKPTPIKGSHIPPGSLELPDPDGMPDAYAEKIEEFLSDYDGKFDVTFYDMPKRLSKTLNALLRIKDNIPDELLDGIEVIYEDLAPGVCGHRCGDQIIINTNHCSWTMATFAHELGHRWSARLAEGAQYLYFAISWREPEGGNRCCRDEDALIAVDDDDFLRLYSKRYPGEDIADATRYYVSYGRHFRRRARRQMDLGNFELAAKYLFVKHVMPFAGKEYSIRGDSLGIDEVKQKYLASKDTARTNEGTFDIILEIEEIMERSKPPFTSPGVFDSLRARTLGTPWGPSTLYYSP